ncbi:hypothetical protein N657DRAFT_646232 [Parathielavia appendiculata]|uniref:Uncharacterized protein n=1 Tax=Parathielavia appendiculata TaxID=2587402 RepID=A0AAN6TZ96_9PEZI|nr:hypothetical protein N657DRAFT_646232 [Parathielavia appendiculata]
MAASDSLGLRSPSLAPFGLLLALLQFSISKTWMYPLLHDSFHSGFQRVGATKGLTT